MNNSKFCPDDWFNQIKAAYPKRARGCGYEWPKARKLIIEHMKNYSFEDILSGTRDYCAASKVCGNYGTVYIKQASTFFGPGEHFLDEFECGEPELEHVYRKPEEVSSEQRKRDRELGEAHLAEMLRFAERGTHK